MIVSVLSLLMALAPQSQAPVASLPFVVSVLNEKVGDDVVLRFVLSGPPSAYSATREGDDILVRISAKPLVGLSLPAPNDPIRALALGTEPGFTLRVTVTDDRPHEIVRDMSSLRLVLKSPPVKAAAVVAPALAAGAVAAAALPSPSPSPSPNRSEDPVAVDTADLYSRLFPASTDPATSAANITDIGEEENWYSNFSWLGIQMRPWVSVTYLDTETTEIETNRITTDAYWVVQPNLGLGFSPHVGGNSRGGEWKINYTPRFRRRDGENLPELTSHFLDIGIDQPIASLGSVYASYHLASAVLETEEIDPGREYGIGRNRVLDSGLERFRRETFGVGVRFDFVAETELDVSASTSRVKYGNSSTPSEPESTSRAFFDYDSRTLSAVLRRGLGASHFLNLHFGIHDTPDQPERKQVEGRGYSYGASVEGDVVAGTTGRILLGYRTQRDPYAGLGGREYKDFVYGAQLLRAVTENSTVGFSADRKLNLSAYEENGFYVADSLKADLNALIPLDVSLRGTFGLQLNGYKTSPQTNDGSSLVLREDKIKYWSVGLGRNFTEWASLRADYIAERRDSNLDRFDLKTRTFTFQLRIGYVGRASAPPRAAW